jgi:acetolactate synthase-1/2/3 large subunit
MSGQQAVVEALKSEGVKFVFGLPGSHSCEILYDSLYDAPNIRTILVRHESSGVFMAMAYARLTNEPGICSGTAGPGVCNMVSGISEAYSACTPVVAICPTVDTRTKGKGALQDIPQVDIFSPITKWSIHVSRADEIPWVMRRAFSVAANAKPGPVFVEIPVDIGTQDFEYNGYQRSLRYLRTRGDSDRVKQAVGLLAKAERPVIVAGGGVVISSAFSELRALAEALCAPILSSVSGRGSIEEDHPLFAGLVGIYSTKISKKVLGEADLVLGVGCRFEEQESLEWEQFPKGAKYVQVDVDPLEIGRNWIPDVAIVGDAKLVLGDVLEELRRKIRAHDFEKMPRVRKIVEAKKEYESEVEAELKSSVSPIKPQRVVRDLNKVFGSNTILVNENGLLDIWSYNFPYYKVLGIGDCVPPGEQTCMGFGVAAAIGAKLTKPNKKVVCTTGDGAFQMLMKEMPTAVQYKAPVTWCILNNSSLGFVRWWQKEFHKGRYIASTFDSQPDFVKIAEASKCCGEQVKNTGDIQDACKRALKANREGIPAVIDFVVDPKQYTPGEKELSEACKTAKYRFR